MLTLDLNANDVALVKALLRQYAPDLEIWAYGSRVNGNAHDASDLDLVLRNSKNLQKPINLSQLKQAFIDSHLPILVDLVDWASLPNSYREEIEKKHILFEV